jgi:hypothetical protein
MTGELFEIEENQLKVVSLDGHRISIRNIELKNNYDHKKVVVPGKTLQEVSKILPGSAEEEVNIFLSENHIVFEFDDTTVVSRLIEGEYFKIEQMLSSDYDTKVKINKRELLDCIDRATLLVKEGDKKPIIMNITDGNMELKINSFIGSMNEDIDIAKEGKDILIGFNPKFFIDALRVIDEEEVTLYMVNPEAIGYINAHGTSTPLGDKAELRAVKSTFGSHANNVMVSSTKSMTGHLLGAAGAIEAIITVLALRDQIAPPTINLDNPDEECDLDLVANVAKPGNFECALSNSFGFGGTNGSLIFKRV